MFAIGTRVRATRDIGNGIPGNRVVPAGTGGIVTAVNRVHPVSRAPYPEPHVRVRFYRGRWSGRTGLVRFVDASALARA